MQTLDPLPYMRQAHDSVRGSWEFLIAPPPADLAGIVECFWISRGQATFLQERIIPQNNVELMFNLERPFGVINRQPPDRSFKRAWISGMQGEWLTVLPKYDVREPSYLLSARLTPLGAHRVLGLPMDRVAHDVIELDDVLGDGANAVQEQLGNLREAGLQFAALCNFVRRQADRSRVRLHPDAKIAVHSLRRAHGALRIEDLCRSLQASRKHLRALLLAHVGLSPKAYARLFRFRRVVDQVQARGTADWAELALSCGYYDQAHFNREFRAFAGITPSEFARSGCVDGLTILEG